MNLLCLSIQPRHALSPALDRAMLQAGFKTYLASSWPSALRALSQWNFDVVLLEPAGVPGDRAGTLAKLRDLRVPVVLAEAAGEEPPYFWPGLAAAPPRPAAPLQLASRLREAAESRFDRTVAPRAARTCGPLRMDPRGARASYGGHELELTNCEFELLLMLIDNEGEFVAREALASVLKHRPGSTRRSTDMHISRIRKKLREAGASAFAIRTVHGRGYCAALDAEDVRSATAGCASRYEPVLASAVSRTSAYAHG